MTTEQAATFSSRQAIAKGNRCPSHKASGRDKSIKRRELEELEGVIRKADILDSNLFLLYWKTYTHKKRKTYNEPCFYQINLEKALAQARASEREQFKKQCVKALEESDINKRYIEHEKLNEGMLRRGLTPTNEGYITGFREAIEVIRKLR
jgi:hypothetical protein